MADSPKTAEAKPDSPHVANLKFRKKELTEKRSRVESAKDDPQHPKNIVLARIDQALAQIDKELKEAK